MLSLVHMIYGSWLSCYLLGCERSKYHDQKQKQMETHRVRMTELLKQWQQSEQRYLLLKDADINQAQQLISGMVGWLLYDCDSLFVWRGPDVYHCVLSGLYSWATGNNFPLFFSVFNSHSASFWPLNIVSCSCLAGSVFAPCPILLFWSQSSKHA